MILSASGKLLTLFTITPTGFWRLWRLWRNFVAEWKIEGNQRFRMSPNTGRNRLFWIGHCRPDSVLGGWSIS
jgi:hypothetical protein